MFLNFDHSSHLASSSKLLYLLHDSFLIKLKQLELESTEKLPIVFQQKDEKKLYNAKGTPMDEK